MRYIIISIEENYSDSDGHILILKANPKKESNQSLDVVPLLFDSEESEETRYFIFPYSDYNKEAWEIRAQDMIRYNYSWAPEEDEFGEAMITFPNGKTKIVSKHFSFGFAQEVPSGIKDIVDSFKSQIGFDISSNPLFLVSDVKRVQFPDGSKYTGKASMNDFLCVPNGFGIKKYPSSDDLQVIGSFFNMGDIGKIAWFEYEDYIQVGCMKDGKPNGWGFKLTHGLFTFGYYKDGKLYKDLSPFATDVYYSFQGRHGRINPVEGKINALALGITPKEDIPFEGFIFGEDGSVYLGKCSAPNEYRLTGTFMKLDVDGKASFGLFDDGYLVNAMSQEEYFKLYTKNSEGQEKIDVNTDYLAQADSRTFLILATGTDFDFDMGNRRVVIAVPYEKLDLSEDGDICFDNEDKEFFVLLDDDDESTIINLNSEKLRLWHVDIDDFNTLYGFISDFTTEKKIQTNYHVHNSIIGLGFSSVTRFDPVEAKKYLEINKMTF